MKIQGEERFWTVTILLFLIMWWGNLKLSGFLNDSDVAVCGPKLPATVNDTD